MRSTDAVLAPGTGGPLYERIADIRRAANLNQGFTLATGADGDEVGAELGHDPAGQGRVGSVKIMYRPPGQSQSAAGVGVERLGGQVADLGVLVDRVHPLGDVIGGQEALGEVFGLEEAEVGGLLHRVIVALRGRVELALEVAELPPSGPGHCGVLVLVEALGQFDLLHVHVAEVGGDFLGGEQLFDPGPVAFAVHRIEVLLELPGPVNHLLVGPERRVLAGQRSGLRDRPDLVDLGGDGRLHLVYLGKHVRHQPLEIAPSPGPSGRTTPPPGPRVDGSSFTRSSRPVDGSSFTRSSRPVDGSSFTRSSRPVDGSSFTRSSRPWTVAPSPGPAGPWTVAPSPGSPGEARSPSPSPSTPWTVAPSPGPSPGEARSASAGSIDWPAVW